ncbi:hypothetical protein TDB9533_03018 [Thalassocella blandensis]|nr:hypothetical protein TDB9533_03018 [Thalassocella blandensis]
MKIQKVYLLPILFMSILFLGCKSEAGSNAQTANVIESKTAGDSLEKLPPLDVLKNYDRDLWPGPDGWTETQWHWKKLLRWDKNCDYVDEVEEHELKNNFQLITVQCVPGSYQPMYYIYLFNKENQKSKQLLLGLPESTDNPKEIFGNVNVDSATNEFSILTLSRGIGDCGTYRLFTFDSGDNIENANLHTAETRQRECAKQLPDDMESLPKEILDFKQWPLIKNH